MFVHRCSGGLVGREASRTESQLLQSSDLVPPEEVYSLFMKYSAPGSFLPLTVAPMESFTLAGSS